MENYMHRTSVSVLILLLAGLGVRGFAQSGEGAQVGSQRPASRVIAVSPQHTYRPRVTLQEALKIAEHYIAEKHIDISAYWLSDARFILMGDDATPDISKIPCWHLWWIHESGTIGDYVEIIVTMDRVASRAPSM